MSARIMACLTAAALALAPEAGAAQSPSDSAAVAATALDYIEGFYRADADRMERALHPELVKRIVRRDTATGRTFVSGMGATRLVAGTAAGAGRRVPEDRRRKDVAVLDVHGDAATARIRAADWVDYLHLVRVDGEWRILNVLWETDEETGSR